MSQFQNSIDIRTTYSNMEQGRKYEDGKFYMNAKSPTNKNVWREFRLIKDKKPRTSKEK